MVNELLNFGSGISPVLLISGNYNVFSDGWDSAGIYMCSGLYKSDTFKLPIYIGSSVNLQKRIETDHISCLDRNKHPNNPILQISWNKHGKENFVWWLLESCGRDETLKVEQKYLDLYRPFKDEFSGFNINHTSSGCVGRKHSEETRRKISESNMGKKYTEESKRKMSETRKEGLKSGRIINGALGRKYSDEEKIQMSRIKSGKPNYKLRKRVLCVETGQIYNSLQDAKQISSIKNISEACIGKYKTAGGFHWEFADQKDKINNKFVRPELKKIRGEEKHCSKLKEFQVLEIRAKYKSGNYSHHKLGKEYSVSRSAIERIVNRKNWIHI